MTGRTPGSPRTPGSGRKRGSIDRAQRQLLTEKMAGDIMRVYQRLGGVAWLLKFAQENPAEFLRQGLSRLFPAPQKDDPDVLIQQQFNGIEGDPIELARRVAFALAKGANALGQDAEVVAQREPYVALAREEAGLFKYPTPAPDPAREQWAREASMTQEERLAAETLDEHVNRRAFAAPRPAWMDEPKPGRPFVGVPKSKRDLL